MLPVRCLLAFAVVLEWEQAVTAQNQGTQIRVIEHAGFDFEICHA